MEVIISNKKKSNINDEVQTHLMISLKYATNSFEIEKIFNELYNNVTKVLWINLTRKYIPPLNYDEMLDVFQDSWVKVLDSRQSFDDSKKVYTWIYTIFKNMIIDRIRYFDRKKTQSIDRNTSDNDNDDRKLEFKADRNSDADFYLIKNEKLHHIKEAINALDDELDKIIIIRRIVEQKKFEEISKELNIPITTIHYKLNKCLDKLRMKLKFLIN
ncbi:MAG TPA: RNA polymerase sigma factor [Candidatus Kapabacteria bacterium]|nr:RNA polymerase sigma factor [Candidatus Kapabacteria bacterium]